MVHGWQQTDGDESLDFIPCENKIVMMRKIILSVFSILLLHKADAQPLNVMTFNIRLNVASDSLNAWLHRKNLVVSQIQFFDVDILGVQEAKPDQMKDLANLLPEYNYIGVARDTGSWGEYSAIFYKKSNLDVLESNTFWLSPTPHIPASKGWDAALTRIVTWGKFKDKKSGKIFFAFNTHFDHIGKVARALSAEMILKAVDSLAGKLPAIVTGDFNTTITDEPYKIITDESNPLHLQNSFLISKLPHYGPTGTFNNWGSKEVNEFPIDFIFVKNGVKVLKHATISESWNGRFSSDHFPVFASLTIP